MKDVIIEMAKCDAIEKLKVIHRQNNNFFHPVNTGKARLQYVDDQIGRPAIPQGLSCCETSGAEKANALTTVKTDSMIGNNGRLLYRHT